MKSMEGMPDHDTLMSGVHGLLGEHLGDGHGKIMSEINALPLDKSEKVMLQAIENMEESMLTTMLEAIQNIQMNVTVQGSRLAATEVQASATPRVAKEAPAKPQPSAAASAPKASAAVRSLSTPAQAPKAQS